MTSKIVVNNIESDAGVSTVFFNSDIGGTGGTLNVDGNLNVDGVLSYEDVTNIDSVGLVTARNGIDVTSGNVNIDSVTSNTPLVVQASQNNRSRIVFRNNVETGTECNIELFDDDLRFITNSGERLRIDANGNLGINNTTPHRQLVVGDGGDISCFGENGGIYFGTSTGGFRNNGAIARAQQAGYHVSGSQVGDLVMAPEADKDLIFSSGSTNTMYERLRVTTGGNIGIHDSSPENTLSIKNIGSFEGDANSFYLGSNFTGTGQNFSGSGKHAQRFFFNNASSNGYLKYENTGVTGNAGDTITWQERLRIDSSGRLGLNSNLSGAQAYNRLVINSPDNSCWMSMHSVQTGSTINSDGLDIGLNQNNDGHIWLRENAPLLIATNGTERLRITSAGALLHKGNNSSTIDNTDGDGQASSGYPAGGATFNKNISVNDNAGGFGQCMNMISHTKSVTLNGSTNHPMVTIFNREGCFIGHVYAGYSTSGDGAVAMYKFNTFYGANSLIAELGPSSRSSDTISVSVDSVGDAHTFRVNGNGYSGDVTVGLVFLSAGVAGSAAHYGVRYY